MITHDTVYQKWFDFKKWFFLLAMGPRIEFLIQMIKYKSSLYRVNTRYFEIFFGLAFALALDRADPVL